MYKKYVENIWCKLFFQADTTQITASFQDKKKIRFLTGQASTQSLMSIVKSSSLKKIGDRQLENLPSTRAALKQYILSKVFMGGVNQLHSIRLCYIHRSLNGEEKIMQPGAQFGQLF